MSRSVWKETCFLSSWSYQSGIQIISGLSDGKPVTVKAESLCFQLLCLCVPICKEGIALLGQFTKMLSYLCLNAWSFLQKNAWRKQSACCWILLVLRKTLLKGSPAWASLQCSWARLSRRHGEEHTGAARAQRGYEKAYIQYKTQHPIELLTHAFGEDLWGSTLQALRSGLLSDCLAVNSTQHCFHM